MTHFLSSFYSPAFALLLGLFSMTTIEPLFATTSTTSTSLKHLHIQSQTHTLKNGLKIVILPSGVTSIVTIGMLVHVGTADDPREQVGLSHFMEHMMFKGTKKFSKSEFDQVILRNGGVNNALTEYDYTLYYTTIAADKLDLILEIEADRLRNLSFDHAQVESEKKVVMEERGMRIENNPMGVVYERYLQAFNSYHPYGILPIGFPHHIEAYSFDSVRNHYDTWYHPNNVTIIITGCTSLETALPLIEKHFGPLKSKPIPNRIRVQNPKRDGVIQKIVQYNKRNALNILLLSYDAPHYFNLEKQGKKGKRLYCALKLLEIILSNTASQFYIQMVEKKKCAINVSSYYDGQSIDPKAFELTAMLSSDMDLQKARTEILAYIEDLIKNGILEKDLLVAQNAFIAGLENLKDGTDGYLFYIADNILGRSRTIEDINELMDCFKDIKPEEIKEAACLIFSAKPVVEVELYPAKADVKNTKEKTPPSHKS